MIWRRHAEGASPRELVKHVWASWVLLSLLAGVDGFAVAPKLGSAVLSLDNISLNESLGSRAGAPMSGGRRRRRTAPCAGNGTDVQLPQSDVALFSLGGITPLPWDLAVDGRAAPNAAVPAAWFHGLELELHLPGQTIPKLLRFQRGSLAKFLHSLQLALGRAAGGDSERRVSMMGIHGRFRSFQNGGAHARLRSMDALGAERLDEEVLVRFHVAGTPGDPDGGAAYAALSRALATPHSWLLQGALGPTLQNATVSQNTSPRITRTPRSERDKLAQIGAIALPMFVTAVLVGILIWVAAG